MVLSPSSESLMVTSPSVSSPMLGRGEGRGSPSVPSFSFPIFPSFSSKVASTRRGLQPPSETMKEAERGEDTV